MFELDQYAQTNRLAPLPAAWKVGAGLGALLTVISLDLPAAHALVLLVMAALTVGAAGLPLRPYLRLYTIPASFIALSLLTVALSVTRSPEPLLWAVPLGGGFIGLSESGVDAALLLFTRSLSGISATYFIALTTPVYQWAGLLHRLKVPREFTELTILVYRFVTIFAEELDTMRQASDLKFGQRNPRVMIRSAAALAGLLFTRVMSSYGSWQRALELKLYRGEFHL
ncbi:cobalt ECF transporter T component CbiQ [Deinococcus sp. HMF7620]|uniref:Cobalt ECF transporter T component CbiQ n=1 Tax=Deinococcus arboris TaxID=2682977 RepID=A0A7C9M1X5_9DEIO|nr:cobalt ECF transporter T component CbiQ [Deinococcus arboris]MVN87102.1 cobalt ECF transporter T component CbiQ [Deinococcus arboris]